MKFKLFATLMLLSGSAFAADSKIAPGNWYGCQHRDTFEKIERMRAEGDKEAAGKVFAQAASEYECTWLPVGTVVLIQETALMSGLVKIRAKGNTGVVWTNMEAVK